LSWLVVAENFLVIDIVAELGKVAGLPTYDMTSTSMHLSVQEDIAGALILAETFWPQFTPQSSKQIICN
jgi:hypothetical protein